MAQTRNKQQLSKENDSMLSKGTSAVERLEKERNEIRECFKTDSAIKQRVMDYIFSGVKDEESPLADIRSKFA